jgi:hypothetical protein
MQIEQQSLAKRSISYGISNLPNDLELIDLEENEVIAKQNLDTLDKFRIGTITTLEFRTAQLNYVNVIVMLNFKQRHLKLH